MSKDKVWEEYKEASKESAYAANRAILEQAKERVTRSNGEAFVRNLLSDKKK